MPKLWIAAVKVRSAAAMANCDRVSGSEPKLVIGHGREPRKFAASSFLRGVIPPP